VTGKIGRNLVTAPVAGSGTSMEEGADWRRRGGGREGEAEMVEWRIEVGASAIEAEGQSRGRKKAEKVGGGKEGKRTFVFKYFIAIFFSCSTNSVSSSLSVNQGPPVSSTEGCTPAII
jgi:hypothetical protein